MTKPREKTREKLTCEIEDEKKKTSFEGDTVFIINPLVVSSVVVSKIGPVDKDEIWAEKLYSQPTFYP